MTLLTTFASATGITTGAPDISILSATNVRSSTATINGRIDNNHAHNVTSMLFEWGRESGIYTASQEITGENLTGTQSVDLDGLFELQTIYFRVTGTNSAGSTTTAEMSFATISTTYAIQIEGINRTTDVINQSIDIQDIINDQQNTCSFSLVDRSGLGLPANDDEIAITDHMGEKVFGGYILNHRMSKLATGVVVAEYECVDYARLLDSNLVHRSYLDMTDAQIIQDVIERYCGDFGITTSNVITGSTLTQIAFNYVQPSQAFRRIAELTNRFWYIDYDKDIHYFPLTTNATPFNITSATTTYSELEISKDNSKIKNRIYVRGGTTLSDPTTYSEKGDGVKKKFPLPDKPHDVSLTVNGVSKTVGIKNVNTSGFDWYLNFQEKYIEQDAGGSTLTSTDTMVLTYSYDIPILIAQEDVASIAVNGVKEFAIFDKTITTTQSARDRAVAELIDYADNIVSGSFTTYTPGFRSGQYININLADYGINDDYVVQSVRAKSMGAGKFSYNIKIASAKEIGIIRFLIDLLEANKNLVELNNDEVVDELFAIADSLLTDSLIESLSIDSAGVYATWCTDSLQSTPTTRARWELFQWG